jgi:hypothetical protein
LVVPNDWRPIAEANAAPVSAMERETTQREG